MTPRRAAPPAPRWRAYAALAAGVVCIALAAIFVKLAAVPGPASAFYRVAIGAAVLLPWRLARRPPRAPGTAVRTALAAGVLYGLDIALWNASLLITSAASSTLLANFAPLWVGIGAVAVLRERVPASFWAGMAVAFVGAAAVLAGDLLERVSLGRGDLLALAASVFYAGYLLAAQRARADLDTVTALAVSLVSSVAVLLALCLALGVPLWGYGGRSWAALAGLGLVSQVGGWLSINYALGFIRATAASVSLLGQPVVAALLAIPIFGERLGPGQLVGGALVLVGIHVVNRRGG